MINPIHSGLASTTPHMIVPGQTPGPQPPRQEPHGEGPREATARGNDDTNTQGNLGQQPRSEEEIRTLQALRARDREVRTHEQAHLIAAGRYARGTPQFSYQRGPDGQLYAVGGEVDIDTSAVPGDPEATIEKARTIRRAANAPAEPSSQDRRVAAEAGAMETKAQQELQQQRLEEAQESGSTPDTAGAQAYANPPDSDTDTTGTLLDIVV